jgi:hypothetical protein
VEAIRALMVARRSAAGERTRTINQARALVLTGPDDIRARFARHSTVALVAALASQRPRPGDVVGYATRVALRELGRRAQFLDGQLERLDELIAPLVAARAPGLLAVYGAGPTTAALLLIAAGDHPGRLRSEAAWAHLCAAAPIPASSGKTVRHRLNPGGDRQANHALWRIVFTRLGSDPATRAYAERRTAEGKSKAEIIRCLIGGLSVPRSGQPGRGSLVALGDGLVAEPVVTASFSTATPGAPRPRDRRLGTCPTEGRAMRNRLRAPAPWSLPPSAAGGQENECCRLGLGQSGPRRHGAR